MITIPRDNLVAEWGLDWDALDTSANTYNWTATNITWVDAEVGYQKKAASFNGSSSYITIGSWLTAFKTSTVTISGWFKTSAANTTWMYVVDNHVKAWWAGSTLNSGIGISIDPNGKVNVDYYMLNSETFTINYADWTTETLSTYAWKVRSMTDVRDGQWHHFVAIVDNNKARLYIDNKLHSWVTTSQSVRYSTTDDNYALWILKYDSNIYYYYNWQLALIRHYNAILSEQDVEKLYLEWLRKLYTSRLAYPKLFEWLVAYYDFRKWDLSNLVDGTLATNNWAMLTADHLGYNNYAYSFNGVDWVYMNLNTYITWNTYTVGWLYKINSADNSWVLLTQGQTTNISNKFIIQKDTNWNIVFAVNNTSGTKYIVSWAPPDGQWHLFIGTFNWTDMKFYQDGVLLWTTAFSGTPVETTDSMTISAYSNNTTYNINWDVALVLAMQRVLSDDEVKTLYNLLMS